LDKALIDLCTQALYAKAYVDGIAEREDSGEASAAAASSGGRIDDLVRKAIKLIAETPARSVPGIQSKSRLFLAIPDHDLAVSLAKDVASHPFTMKV
jgi:hypothetical protein